MMKSFENILSILGGKQYMLIFLLQNGTAEGKTKVARTLWNITCNANNKSTIRKYLSVIEETDMSVKTRIKDAIDKIKYLQLAR